MTSRVVWAKFNLLKEMIADAQADFYGDDEDWQPAYLGISPDLEECVIEYDIAQIPVGWHIENACLDAEEIANQYFDLR